jgi:hypothetical protein
MTPSPPCPFLLLPNELLALIITHLIPTSHPISHLSILVFRPYKPYYALPYRSAALLHLSRTCRGLRALTAKLLGAERARERGELREAREVVAGLLCGGMDREIAVGWLEAWQEYGGEGRGAGGEESSALALGFGERLIL